MSVIKRLDTVIANKIAAGEVIEKIGNVVKELVENSVDANSTKIDIDLLESGLKQITVTDNGDGMDECDAILAFERHATSKIENVTDLFRINSLGFRGEAIPSIASISRVELVTNNGDSGIKVVYEDGKFIEKTDAQSNKGTKISVTKLFYTTPARFKYLKSPQYELAIIQSMINKFALSYPNISFRLTNNQKLIFVSRGNGIVLDIIATIYSIDIAKSMLEFEHQSRDYSIKGYTTKPIINRSSRNYISIFVNKRNITDTKIQRAITDCYEQLMPKNRYPITVLYIECDPSIIDVNIHPRKQEIKFSEYKALLELIKSSIEKVLKPTPIIQPVKDVEFIQPSFNLSEPIKEYQQQPVEPIKETVSMIEDLETKEEITLEQPQEEPQEKPVDHILNALEYIGQYTGTYLIFQNNNGLYLVDQHAAAERIRYENYLKSMLKGTASQALLLPLELDLENTVVTKLAHYTDKLLDFGLEVLIENQKIYITKVPSWFGKGYELVYAEAIIMNVLEEKDFKDEAIIDELAILLACKHSLKANHYLSREEANILIQQLSQCRKPYTCPHGRPIVVEITNYQIEKLFKRVI